MTWMSGARRHWPEDIWDTAMAVLSCRKTEERAGGSQHEQKWLEVGLWQPHSGPLETAQALGLWMSGWPSTVLSKPRQRFNDGWDSNLGLQQHALGWD